MIPMNYSRLFCKLKILVKGFVIRCPFILDNRLPEDGGALEYPVNAGKIPVTALPGASYFDSANSFAMIRGRHVDVAIMGGLEVDEGANLANWAIPGKPLLGVGGTMDLASGAKN